MRKDTEEKVAKPKGQVASTNCPENDALRALLKEARLSKGIGTEKLAKLAGLDRNCIRRIELNHRRVDLIEFYTIVKALEMDPLELFRRFLDEVERMHA